MDLIKQQLLDLRKRKTEIDYQDMASIVEPYHLSDEEIDELIIWINNNNLNIKVNDRTDYGSQYTKDISVFPTLSQQEEYQLAKKVMNGDRIAKDKFIKSNLQLVVKIVKGNNYYCNGLSENDLIQEGNIGLCIAVDHFDPDRNVRFAAYGQYWIKKKILEAIDKARVISVPPQIRKQIKSIKDVMEEFQQKYQRQPDYSEIAKLLSITEKRVIQLLSYEINVYSIDDTNINLVASTNNEPHIGESALTVLESLNSRDKEIVSWYFGLQGKDKKSNVEIAKMYGLSKQRVGQIVKKAIVCIKDNYDK